MPPLTRDKIFPLTRDKILRAEDLKRQEVDMTPFGWPGSVWVQGMSGLERGRFEEDLQKDGSFPRFRALLLVKCLVDDGGLKLFTEDDVDALNSKNAAALDHLYDIGQKLSGWRKADIDEMTKNSSKGQSDVSTTD